MTTTDAAPDTEVSVSPVSMSPVSVSHDRDGAGRCTVRVSGQIDLSSAPVLHASVDEVVRSTPTLVRFELSGVEFMDSSGIAVLLATAGAVPSVQLVNPSAAVRRVIELSGLSSVLPVIS